MYPELLYGAIGRRSRSLFSLGRSTRILAATALTILLATRAESATGAQSAVTLTKGGTLLAAEVAPLGSIFTVSRLGDGFIESVGAVTLSSKVNVLAAGFANPVEVSFPVPAASFVTQAQVSEPILYLASSDSGSFATFASWQEQTVAFEEMSPVPEPATWLAASFVFGFLIWQQRRRFLSCPISRRTSGLINAV